MDAHTHKWVYRGVVYTTGRQLPGTSARERFYFDMYFCETCLDKRYESINYVGKTGWGIEFNAIPKGT